jgi:Cof subfamily protein (haloacid dehalogenase superfamily)
MTEEIKLIAFDLDGTLLDSQKEIPANSLAAIRTLLEKGIVVTIITGRPLYSTLRYIDELGLDSYFSISDSSIIINRQGHNLHNTCIDPDAMQRIREMASIHNCGVVWASNKGLNDDFFISQNDNDSEKMKEFIRVESKVYSLDVKLLRVKDKFETDDLKSYMVFILGLKDEIRKLTSKLNPMKDKMTILSNIGLNPVYHHKLVDTHNLMIMRPCHSGKLHGLKKICDHYRTGLENTMFFGDWHNDIDALDGVGYPILMDNAPEDIDRSRYHLTGSNDTDGVVEALRHFNLV